MVEATPDALWVHLRATLRKEPCPEEPQTLVVHVGVVTGVSRCEESGRCETDEEVVRVKEDIVVVKNMCVFLYY